MCLSAYFTTISLPSCVASRTGVFEWTARPSVNISHLLWSQAARCICPSVRNCQSVRLILQAFAWSKVKNSTYLRTPRFAWWWMEHWATRPLTLLEHIFHQYSLLRHLKKVCMYFYMNGGASVFCILCINDWAVWFVLRFLVACKFVGQWKDDNYIVHVDMEACTLGISVVFMVAQASGLRTYPECKPWLLKQMTLSIQQALFSSLMACTFNSSLSE